MYASKATKTFVYANDTVYYSDGFYIFTDDMINNAIIVIENLTIHEESPFISVFYYQ